VRVGLEVLKGRVREQHAPSMLVTRTFVP
jgi:hypothetical protein